MAVQVDERVVLFSRAFGQRLEPVGDMGHMVLERPFLHAASHAVGRLPVKRLSFVDTLEECLQRLRIQVFPHFGAVKHALSEIFRDFFLGNFNGGRLLDESFPHQIGAVDTHKASRFKP